MARVSRSKGLFASNIKVARSNHSLNALRAAINRKYCELLDARALSQHNRTAKSINREVESQLHLSELLGKSSDYTEKMESKAHRHTVLIDGFTLKVLRILEDVNVSVDTSNGEVDFDEGLSQISPTTMELTTNYHIEIVRKTRTINIPVDAGLTENLNNRVKGSGKYHWKDKVNKAVKKWRKVHGEYPSTVRVVFLGGNLSSFEQRDVEKAMTKLAKMIAPKTLISGKNFSDRVTTQPFPTWVIPGVRNLGAGKHLSRTPECLTTNERKMAKKLDRIYNYQPKKKATKSAKKHTKKKEMA